ncbi:MAG TPA: right-handed parallel beta-helix repeat-containing protein [Candidatus Moranbacteria bacterium]|nr:right-handed parallel beta-helix repeat-containing protein [Candidatus Moranbacteria bacterium]
MKISRKKAIFTIACAVFILPIVAFSSHKDTIWVDCDANGKEDGSSKHPYEKISDAMDEADSGDEIRVRDGEYHENVKIKSGVKLKGSGKYETIIKAKHHDKPAVTMKHGSKISEVTVKNGESGIKVESDGKATIEDCLIKRNDRDGIEIEKGSTLETRRVLVYESIIKENGRAGINSKKRRVDIAKNQIYENKSDGIRLASGTSAWINNNMVRDNKGSGLVATIDFSDIWIKDNQFRDSDREGLEISSYGNPGKINIQKSKIWQNSRYGIARVSRNTSVTMDYWNKNLTYNGLPNQVANNVLGQISGNIFVLN